ncbi:MAG: hypothetical protein R3F20_03430 [Planctomycetota bacterium]
MASRNSPVILGFGLIAIGVLGLLFFVVDAAFRNRGTDLDKIPGAPSSNPEPDKTLDPRGREWLEEGPRFEDVFDVEGRRTLDDEELRMRDLGRDIRYRAREGDTLEDLARKYFGEGDFAPLLRDSNPDLAPGRPIPPGTEIVIPFSRR